jgi:hypothetical protein
MVTDSYLIFLRIAETDLFLIEWLLDRYLLFLRIAETVLFLSEWLLDRYLLFLRIVWQLCNYSVFGIGNDWCIYTVQFWRGNSMFLSLLPLLLLHSLLFPLALFPCMGKLCYFASTLSFYFVSVFFSLSFCFLCKGKLCLFICMSFTDFVFLCLFVSW